MQLKTSDRVQMVDSVTSANMSNERIEYEKEKAMNMVANIAFLLSLNLPKFLRYFF
jgi:hypothetical protein